MIEIVFEWITCPTKVIQAGKSTVINFRIINPKERYLRTIRKMIYNTSFEAAVLDLLIQN